MYLSKLVLNIRDRQARRDLASPYELHRTLWRAFPENDPGRILFRVDSDQRGGAPIVLVQSDLAPDWGRLEERGARYLLGAPDFKEFAPTFATGQQLRFRLRANPTKKLGTSSKQDRLDGNKDNGQRVALLCDVDQVAWLVGKGDKGGFQVPGEWLEQDEGKKRPNFRVDVVPEGWVGTGKEGHTAGRFYAVRFDGVLQVTDPGKFLKTLADGVGSAKGFGFGLLSVAPPR